MLVKYLVMIFKTKAGSLAALSVSGIRDGLTPEDVADAMDVVIAKDAFIVKGGSLVEKHSAQIVTRNVDEIVVG